MARAGDELVNPLAGERIVFRRAAAETEGRLLGMDAHCFRIGGAELTAAPGEVVTARAGVARLAWNAGDGPAHVRIEMTPALGWERFVESLFALASAAHAEGRHAPEGAALRGLMREFPREIALPGAG